MMNRASMSSGIGAYAPRYMQKGGGVVEEVYDEVNSRTGALDDVQSGNTFAGTALATPFGNITLTAEQLAALPPDVRAAMLAAGYQGGANTAANTKALPDYLTIENGLVRIDPNASNLQFINFLNDLGLFSDKKYDGLTDYEWFVKATKDNPSPWISQLFNDPNKDFVVDDTFATQTNYNETNLERFRRLANLINPASQSGGAFQATARFLQDKGQSLTGGVSGSGTAGRQVFIGQRPTGLGLDPNTGQPSQQQPYYTQSDVLVDSTEQPNLYTYNINPATGVGQFDPMVTTTTANPFDTPATSLSTSYTAPTTTTSFDSNVDFSKVFADVVTPDKVREFYRTYLGRDPGPNEYVMQFVQSGKTLAEIEQEIMNSPEAKNFAITGVPVSSAEELAAITNERMAVTPEKVRGFYQQYLGRDPGNNEFVMGWVNSGMSLADVEAQIAASAEAQNFATTGVAAVTPTAPAVTLQSVQDLYQKNLGRQGAEEYVMNWVNSGMSLADIDQAIQNSPEGLAFASSVAGTASADTTTDTTQTVTGTGTAPADTTTSVTTPVDTTQTVADTTTQTVATTNEDGVPVGPTGLTSTQAALQAIEEKNAAEAAAAAAAAQSPANTFTNILSTVQNPSSVKKEEDKPRISFENMYKTGFATGGIVGLTDGMSLAANSGQGLESFLRSRSKAALRRNLAKVAPQPTMQTGIMPMAR